MEVTDGPANPGDWVAFYAAGAPDGTYLSWRYLNNSTALPSVGSVTSMLTFQAPSASGSYEFRFFVANSFARLATSTTLVVSTSAAQLVVNGTAPPTGVTVGAGSTAVVTVSDGPGNTTDWVALAVFGSAPNAYVDWRYLSGTTVPPQSAVTAATLTFAMPTTAGEFEFRFFANNSLDQIAASSRVTVLAPVAALSVNGVLPPTPLSAAPETAVAVGISGGPGNATDWVALARPGTPDSSYIAWKYLSDTTSPPGAGLTAATLHFTLPAQFDTYEFRLFANNGFSRLATSTNVVVSTEPPLVSISLTDPFPGTTFNAPSSIAIEAAASVTNGTITRVEFFSGAALIGTATTSPDVSITIGASGTGAGTLGQPIASPPAGASIRYTTDGSHPADYGVVYSGPIAISAPTTVLAIAVQGGWVASAMLGATYQIDAVPPAISTRVLPPPNAAGWNNTDVTVTFVCTDNVAIGSCPVPVVVSQEGTSVVAGTATDTAGNQTTANTSVRIDRTVPVAMLTNLTDGLVTTATSLAVSGQLSDLLAGVTTATCNGVAATLSSGTVQCDVPLQPGQNAVVVHARDAAGNGMSAGVNVTRVGSAASVKVSPSERTLLVGLSHQFSLVDDDGVVLTATE